MDFASGAEATGRAARPDRAFHRKTPARTRIAATTGTTHAGARRRAAGVTAVSERFERASRSKARSRAVWNRRPDSFSRQCRTTRSTAGGTWRFVAERSGGSSLRIALIVKAPETLRNARWPDSIL